MAIKTLRYTVTADGVSPNYERRAGMQYDHKKTDLQFSLDQGFYDELIGIISDGSAAYRFDCYDGEGTLHLGEVKSLVSLTLDPYELDYWVTRFGGKLKVCLVITISSNSVTQKEFSYEIALYLEDLPESDKDENQYQSLSTLAGKTAADAESAGGYKAAVEEMYKKLISLEKMLNEGEWVFNGEAGSQIDIKFIIDDKFDGESNNALANRVITARFKALDQSIARLTDNIGQNVYNSIVGEIKSTILDETHPVGSYYWSSNATDPAVLFGGVWQRVKDVFVLAAGDEYGCGTAGGEARHTLTEKEMPKHKHMFNPEASVDGVNFVVPTKTGGTGVSSIKQHGTAHSPGHWASQTWGTDYRGGSQSHNNMPPYVAAYCWQRTE